ncbi:MAG: MarR family winged helix-turn-helix transcriptional regulator [Propionibacteriaceae bacterium]
MALPPEIPEHYWYDDPDVVAVLESLRAFRRADQAMRRRVSASMAMNGTDLQALQLVIAAERRRTPVTPRVLADHLQISTASTTKLLDRLTASGHLDRVPHPSDRRSLVLVATEHAHEEIRERLGHMHARMAEIAGEIPTPSRTAVSTFLHAMAEQLDTESEIAPLTPAPAARGKGQPG